MARGRSNFKMGTVELIVLFLLDKSDRKFSVSNPL